MQLLLDTHIVIAMVNKRLEMDFPVVQRLLLAGVATGFVSVASLWEIAIKSRLGKLKTDIPVTQIPDFLESSGITLLAIEVAHVMVVAQPEPQTRDPFDRLLLAQCQVEGLRLATVDRALVSHRLALQL